MPELEKTKKTDVWKVKFSQLILLPNLREDMVDIPELVASIKLQGVIKPLDGYREGNVFYVRDGSRRHAAMEVIYKETGEDIQCFFMIEPRGTTEDQALKRQFTANDSKEFTVLEKAIGVKKFVDEYGYSIKSVAEALSYTETYIKRLLSLANAPAELLVLVREKKIMGTFAMDRIAEGKAKVDDFLVTHKEGKFAKYQEGEILDQPEFKSKKEKKQGDVTKKDLMDGSPKIPNSWNEAKKYLDKADYLTMYEAKIYSPVEVFQFLLRLKNNEITYGDVQDFLMASKEVKEKKIKEDIKDSGTTVVNNRNGETVVREYPK